MEDKRYEGLTPWRVGQDRPKNVPPNRVAVISRTDWGIPDGTLVQADDMGCITPHKAGSGGDILGRYYYEPSK